MWFLKLVVLPPAYFICAWHDLHQQFSIPILTPIHPPTYFACLSLLTHLIQIISSLEVRSVHELCSDWHAPYTQCPLLPTPWAGKIRCSLLHFGMFIHGLRCATSSSTDECDIIYLWYIQFEFTSCTLICTLNGILSLWIGIMVEYPGMSTSQGTYVRKEQTSEAIRVTYTKCAEWVGRTGIENRWFTHSVSSPGRAYQVVHKSQMLAFEVVGAFLIIHAITSLLHCMLLRQSMYATNDVRKASVDYNWLWSITEPIPNRPRLHRDAP